MSPEIAPLSYNNDPYIVIAQQEWELNLGSNARNLAVEFSKTRPVLYVNPAIDIRSLKQVKSRHGRKRLKTALNLAAHTMQVSESLWVHTPATIGISINWLSNEKMFDAINRFNANRFFKSLKRAIILLGWNEKTCTVLNDSQMFTGKHLHEFFTPKNNFYYIRDNLVSQPYFGRHGKRIEPLTIQKASAVFANSAFLADYAGNYNNKTSDIGQGCELDMYDSESDYAEPEDLKHIPRPRLGYIGFLTADRLDISLLEQLALAHTEWHWVLIGPEDPQFKKSKLHTFSNVHFLGSRSPKMLPAYLRHLDVCLNPQLVNDLTIGNYPRKIDEYLAMGKPTVATDTPAMKMFAPHVFLANGPKEYRSAISRALMGNSPQDTTKAISFARAHTWQACVEKIYEVQKSLIHA